MCCACQPMSGILPLHSWLSITASIGLGSTDADFPGVMDWPETCNSDIQGVSCMITSSESSSNLNRSAYEMEVIDILIPLDKDGWL